MVLIQRHGAHGGYSRFTRATVGVVLGLAALTHVSWSAWYVSDGGGLLTVPPTTSQEPAAAALSRSALRRQLNSPGVMTYTKECQKSYLYNRTWGRERSPWVDKAGAKELIAALQVPDLQIPRTLMLMNRTTLQELTIDGLRGLSLPADYVVKPTFTSGAVARVVNGTRYSCFKKCRFPAEDAPLPEAYGVMLDNMRYSLEHFHSDPRYERRYMGRQTQYHYVPRQILLEERLDLTALREWHWWTVGGHVLFVCARCGLAGSYFTADFRPLRMSVGSYPACAAPPARPRTWEAMRTIVSQLGRHIGGVMRLDLYADDRAVYFSEVTFTTSNCAEPLRPAAADALLYAVLRGQLPARAATPDVVEAVINGAPEARRI